MGSRNPMDYSKELELYKQSDSARKMGGRSQVDFSIELESQFILRLPEEPAKLLREVLQCGVNIKDRLTIQIEPDMRSGQVRFDHWLMHAKIVDLPCIVESLKTIDNKSFYKTADICQMMICKMEPDPIPPEDESTKNKKKDPYKVDKKYLYPHGLTPPAKNVRKRRFRKTLKKKFVEAPEIEKEVKRLLRSDCEAVGISWEVITEEDNGKNENMQMETNTGLDKKSKEGKEKKLGPNADPEISNVEDIFGGGLSDSDMDEDNINVEMEDTSRLSTYDSRLSDSSSMPGDPRSRSKLPTQFQPDMFQPMRSKYRESNEFQGTSMSGHSQSHSRSITPAEKSGFSQGGIMSSDDDADYTPTISKESIVLRMDQLKMELEELKQQKHRTQQEIVGMDNQTLRQRFQDILHNLEQEILSKEMEYQDLQTLQQQAED